MTDTSHSHHVLTEAERHKILTEWNKTARDYPRHVCLHQVIEEQVKKTPQALAVQFEGQSLSYVELNARANWLARRLQEMGVGPDVLVGICLDRSLEMVVGLLAILKAGGAYVPFDPAYPQERLAFMLEDANVALLLTQESLLDSLPKQSVQTLSLDRLWTQMAQEGETNLNSNVSAENLAYVIYTSGSTGRPKGVMNTHRGICNRLFWMQEEYQLTASDKVLQKTPFSFDVSVWEFFWPLMTGASLLMARPGGQQDNGYLVKLIAEQKITILHFVPSMLQLFLDEPELTEQCRSLRHVICSGEALTFEMQKRFFERLNCQLHNLYGPTEAAVDVTYWVCKAEQNSSIVPIGYPVANTQIYILDEKLNPLPIETPGELHIGGVQVARGYLNRPELSKEKFIPDPFSDKEGARLYKTGDLARFRPDGAIEFLGRLDHQVKVRGFRIELGEIEAVLESHGAIKQATVLAREDRPGDKRLVAYLVSSGEVPLADELRQYLQEHLPEYMTPAAFVKLSQMPLTHNGKVDRSALPVPDKQRPKLSQAYVAPRSDLERYLTALWRNILGLEQIGVNDKFFELGGSSLQAAQFVNELQGDLGEFIYVTTIFEHPSVAQYAEFLQRDYVELLNKKFGRSLAHKALSSQKQKDHQPSKTIDEDAIAQMQSAVPKFLTHVGNDVQGVKNPPAIFILAPPRSGTTLLRVMLAGHSALFAGSELQLLSFETLEQRREAFSGKFSLWQEGTIRTIMELKACDAKKAKSIMASYEQQNVTTKEFYRILQDQLDGKMLVDKSPSYAFDPASLQKAERDFSEPLYIHLVRHPYAMVRSFESYHMDQVLFLYDHPFNPRQLGELVWTVSHQNILSFLKGVPPQRQHRLYFEELVKSPQENLEALCQTFGLTFHPEMVQPYKNLDKKMTDGLYADSTPMGDTKLLERREIDSRVADVWQQVKEDDFLGDITWRIANDLGYEMSAVKQTREVLTKSSPTDRRKERLARQRQFRQARRKAEK